MQEVLPGRRLTRLRCAGRPKAPFEGSGSAGNGCSCGTLSSAGKEEPNVVSISRVTHFLRCRGTFCLAPDPTACASSAAYAPRHSSFHDRVGAKMLLPLTDLAGWDCAAVSVRSSSHAETRSLDLAACRCGHVRRALPGESGARVAQVQRECALVCRHRDLPGRVGRSGTRAGDPGFLRQRGRTRALPTPARRSA